MSLTSNPIAEQPAQRHFGVAKLRSLLSLYPAMALMPVILVAATLRLPRLDATPMFTDEDFYTWTAFEIRKLPWAEALSYPATYVNKPPLGFILQSWLIAVLSDPVTAGRLIGAVSGIGITVLCFFLGRRFGGPAVGVVSALLYAISPVAVLHERMAIYDGPMSFFSLAIVLLSWTSLERKSWRIAALAAISGVLAVQFKVSAVVIACIPVLLAFVVIGPWRDKIVRTGVLALGPVISYEALMLSPLGKGLSAQNQDRLAPFAYFRGNLDVLRDTILTYFPLGLGLLVLVGVGFAVRRYPRNTLVLLAAIAVWSLPWLVLSNFAPSRYYLPAVPFICVLAAIAMVRLTALAARYGGTAVSVFCIAALTIVVAASAVTSAELAFQHRTAPMTKEDDIQYRSGWPSGYAHVDAARFISAVAQPGSAVAYVVSSRQLVASGFCQPLPQGVKSLGLFKPEDRLPVDYPGVLYFMVDDGWDGDKVAAQRHQLVQAQSPELHPIARFTRPNSQGGVTVYRMP